MNTLHYPTLLAVVLVARLCDFLSTWLVTPDLTLEANPVVRKLGWRRSAVLDLCMCLMLAVDARLAIPVATASLLIASRNCDLSAGAYRRTCIALASLLMGAIGFAVVVADREVESSIGFGFLLYGLLSLWFRRVWRLRGRPDWATRRVFVRK